MANGWRGVGGRVPMEQDRDRLFGRGHRDLAARLRNQWIPKGRSVAVLQGFSGVGKTRTGRALVDDAGPLPAVFVEVPSEQASAADVVLDATGKIRQLVGGTDLPSAATAGGFARQVAAPCLVVIDEFQRVVDPEDGSLRNGFEELVHELSVGAGRGRVLLITNRRVDGEPWAEDLDVFDLADLDEADAVEYLTHLLGLRDRLQEIPAAQRGDVVRWVGGNPRALQALVGALGYATLDECIDLDRASWMAKDRAAGRQFHRQLERRFVARTLDHLDPQALGLMQFLSVFRGPFRRDAFTTWAERQHEPMDESVDRLVEWFMVDHHRRDYAVNPVARELAIAGLRADPRRTRAAHSAAGAYYGRPFLTGKVQPGLRGGDFVEAAFHLTLADEEAALAPIAQPYGLHLAQTYRKRSPVPSDPDELDQRIAIIAASLTGGSVSWELSYHLAKLYLARGAEGDAERAFDEATELIATTTQPEAWQLYLELCLDHLDHDAACAAAVQAAERVPEVGVVLAAMDLLTVAGESILAAAVLDEALRSGVRDDDLQLAFRVVQMAATMGDWVLIDELIAREWEQPEHRDSLHRHLVEVADVLSEHDRLDSALEAVRQAALLPPGGQRTDQGVFVRIARRFAAAGRDQDDLEVIDEALRVRQPEQHISHLVQEQARALVRLRRPDEALGALVLGREREVGAWGQFHLYEAHARILVELGRSREAVELLQEATDRLPVGDNVADLFQLVVRISAEADPSGALDWAARGLETLSYPSIPSIPLLKDLAWLVARLGLPREATDLLLVTERWVDARPMGASLVWAALLTALAHGQVETMSALVGRARVDPDLEDLRPLAEVLALEAEGRWDDVVGTLIDTPVVGQFRNHVDQRRVFAMLVTGRPVVRLDWVTANLERLASQRGVSAAGWLRRLVEAPVGDLDARADLVEEWERSVMEFGTRPAWIFPILPTSIAGREIRAGTLIEMHAQRQPDLVALQAKVRGVLDRLAELREPLEASLDPAHIAAELAQLGPLGPTTPAALESIDDFVAGLLDTFRKAIEERGGWRLLWHDDQSVDEKTVQHLFRLLVEEYCRAADVDLTAESNAGRGPVDFKFSRGWNARVLVEVKLARNSQIGHGIDRQTPTYQRAERVHAAYVLVIAFSDGEASDSMRRRSMESVEAVSARDGLDLRVFFVDARKQPSASKV